MEEIAKTILKDFDVTKFKKTCNVHGCQNTPKHAVHLYEYKKMRTIDISVLYLCSTHRSRATELLKVLKNIAPNRILQIKVIDLGR